MSAAWVYNSFWELDLGIWEIEGALGAYVLDCVAYVTQTLTRIVNVESKEYHMSWSLFTQLQHCETCCKLSQINSRCLSKIWTCIEGVTLMHRYVIYLKQLEILVCYLNNVMACCQYSWQHFEDLYLLTCRILVDYAHCISKDLNIWMRVDTFNSI